MINRIEEIEKGGKMNLLDRIWIWVCLGHWND